MEEHTITQILAELGHDNDSAMRVLMPKVYGELRKLAATHLKDDRPGHTLQPTALVNEAFVRLANSPTDQLQGRVHFFRLASKVMRQVLIDHARGRAALKRGGGNSRITLDGAMLADQDPVVDLLALEDALVKLEALDPRMAQLVELRFFGGLTEQEAAGVQNISRTQASRNWRAARAWLASELS
ncbi:MAG: ECF-type sigma factor [Phycisphaerales bacterium]